MSATLEDVVLRAEVRRQKILENASRRLESVMSKADKGEISTCQSSDSIPSYQINGPIAQATLFDTSTVLGCEKQTDSIPGKQGIDHIIQTLSGSSAVSTSEKLKPGNNGHALNGNCVQVSNKTNTLCAPPKLTTSTDQNKFVESISSGSQTLFPNNIDFKKHIQLLGNQSTLLSQDGKENLKKNEITSHLQYAALAVVVRLMLYFQIGWMFGEMILVPFVLTESIQLSLGHVHTSQLITMLGQVVTLCGFSSQLVQTYGKINSILLHCIEDFSVYLVVFCILQMFLDKGLESR